MLRHDVTFSNVMTGSNISTVMALCSLTDYSMVMHLSKHVRCQTHICVGTWY